VRAGRPTRAMAPLRAPQGPRTAFEAGQEHPHLVTYAGGLLSVHAMVEGEWGLRAAASLPRQFHDWDLVDVGLGDRGFIALFDDGAAGQILHLDRHDLEVVRHLVCLPDDDTTHALTADHLGRVYIQAGQWLYRM
jgi:hypothetical protein